MQALNSVAHAIQAQPRRYQAQLIMAMDLLCLSVLAIPVIFLKDASGLGHALQVSPWLSGGLVAALLGAALLIWDDPDLGLLSALLKVVGYAVVIGASMELLGDLQSGPGGARLTGASLLIALGLVLTDHLFQSLLYLGYLGSPRELHGLPRQGVNGWLQRHQGNRPLFEAGAQAWGLAYFPGDGIVHASLEGLFEGHPLVLDGVMGNGANGELRRYLRADLAPPAENRVDGPTWALHSHGSLSELAAEQGFPVQDAQLQTRNVGLCHLSARDLDETLEAEEMVMLEGDALQQLFEAHPDAMLARTATGHLIYRQPYGSPGDGPAVSLPELERCLLALSDLRRRLEPPLSV